ncbi:MAG: nucleoside monophosphate kinase [Candidatus Cloacimonetes bacterium]|nr:nucleoside monophosphate kinase [Candidatus Cloacimonadota bacterium]
MIDAIVILGIQGSGKGTQAKLLAERIGFYHLNMGELLRAKSAVNNPLGLRVKSVIDKGEMVSDELAFEFIAETFRQEYAGVIFDGFPRTLNQAEYLIQHFRLLKVYYLELNEHDAIARIEGRRICSGCGVNYHLVFHPPQQAGICDECGHLLITRADDSPEATRERIRAFYEQTYMLKSYFERMGYLQNISAEGSIQEIHAVIMADYWGDI